MKDIIYGLTEEKHYINSRENISYGISVYDSTTEEGTMAVLKYIGNITTYKDKLTELVNKCNALEISSVHLFDVVEDFLE